MNKIIAALLLSSPFVGPAMAQRLEPAPVPNRGAETVAPADRVGRPDGGERAAPFSGLPNSLGAGAGQDTPATSGSAESTRTAPAPSLSR